jgi:hypothetical protein
MFANGNALLTGCADGKIRKWNYKVILVMVLALDPVICFGLGFRLLYSFDVQLSHC